MQTSARASLRAAKDGARQTDVAPSPDSPTPRRAETVQERLSTGLLLVLAGLASVAHMLVAGNDVYFRDELYCTADLIPPTAHA